MYGNCFSFNFKSDTNSSESVALPGPGYGLSLVVNLEQEHYGGITQSAGARCPDLLLNSPARADSAPPWEGARPNQGAAR